MDSVKTPGRSPGALEARRDVLVPGRTDERIAILERGELVGGDAGGAAVAVGEAEAVGQRDVAALHRGRDLDGYGDGVAARDEAGALAGGDTEGGGGGMKCVPGLPRLPVRRISRRRR
jgi:hypothetical protein